VAVNEVDDRRELHPFAEQTGFLVQWAHQKMRSAINEVLKPLGFNTRHLAVLNALAVRGPLTQRAINDLLDMDKSVVVYVLDELERRNLAERRRVEHDRRAYEVHLTADGLEQVAEIAKIAGPVNHQLLAPLEEAERGQLNDFLWRIILAAEEPGASAS
jgi:DNA-binding MarR family transcriptional regulator